MRSMADTIARLAAQRAARSRPSHGSPTTNLSEMTLSAPNPGALKAWTFVPEGLEKGRPLIVVLHGCTQTAAGYDHAAAWSELADRSGFAVLYPEQQRQNNPNNCFNWFEPGDLRKGAAEALSIRNMIGEMVARHAIDERRVYVTGLSAGGAMAAMLLAKYPDVFAGGAIIAGLAYGIATTVPEAFDRMRGHGIPDDARLQALLRDASDHRGPWPTISVWQGSADSTVDPINAKAILAQWRSVHAVDRRPTTTGTLDGQVRRVWCDASGRECLEEITIAGMGHGTPLDSNVAGGGVPAPFMLDVGIASTLHIARSWGLIPVAAAEPARTRTASKTATKTARTPEPADFARSDRMPDEEPKRADQAGAGKTAADGKIGKVIEDALKAAGLMR